MRTINNPNASAAMTAQDGHFFTQSAYLSGCICGTMWMPSAMGGKPIRMNMRGVWGFFGKGDTFRESLGSLLMKEGGDFQNSQFTADTVLRVERRTRGGNGQYTVHVWEREIVDLHDCADLVNKEAFTSDFIGDEI